MKSRSNDMGILEFGRVAARESFERFLQRINGQLYHVKSLEVVERTAYLRHDGVA